MPLSGMLPGFKVLYKVHRYFIYAQFMQHDFEENFTFFALRLLGSIAAHLAAT